MITRVLKTIRMITRVQKIRTIEWASRIGRVITAIAKAGIMTENVIIVMIAIVILSEVVEMIHPVLIPEEEGNMAEGGKVNKVVALRIMGREEAVVVISGSIIRIDIMTGDEDDTELQFDALYAFRSPLLARM